jgi:anaerobic magnesium-protoporphyrin IX monomethyl ester cyclase
MKEKVRKIMLIQPPDPPKTRIMRDHMGKFGILERDVGVLNYILPPLDLAYSASLLEENGIEVDLIDAPALGLSSSRIISKISEKSPDLIVIDTTGVSSDHDLGLASSVRETTDAPIAFSTSYPNLIYENALRNGVDYVIKGEIEYTILELSQKIPRVDEIKGIIYRKNGKIIHNPDRPFIQNLDDLPFPAYHLLPMNKYFYGSFRKRPFTTFLSSRGCPYRCIYCAYPIGFGSSWRGRSAQNVLAELKLLHEKFNVKSILFRDQVFTFDMKRAEEICDGVIKEGLDLEWKCETRVDCLSKSLMKKMGKAGCTSIHMGIETGDQERMKNFAKVGLTKEMVKKTFKQIKSLGIGTVAFFIIGLPGETKETIQKSIDFARELNSNTVYFTPAVPYPGTQLYEMADKKGWILTKDWKEYNARNVVMRTDDLSADEIKQAVDFANNVFSKKFSGTMKTMFSKRGISLFISNPKNAIKVFLRDLEKRTHFNRFNRSQVYS